MLIRLIQSLKTSAPIETRSQLPAVNVTVSRLVQFRKALEPIVKTPLGIVMLVRLVQSRKA
jgi:hypothetical protein